MNILLVVDRVEDWDLNLNTSEVTIVSSVDYLTSETYELRRSARVFNLCRSYSYQESGYYVSLLATARGQKVIPSISTILELKIGDILKIRSHELDDLIQKSLKDIKSNAFELSIYFGRNLAKKYQRLSEELHDLFHSPLIRARFTKKDKWKLSSVTPIALKDVPTSHRNDLSAFAAAYFRKRIQTAKVANARFSLAILLDPNEPNPPSNEQAIQKFCLAAKNMQIDTEIISKNEISRLAEFDALFIRATTSVNHYTYRFAQKAQALGLVVVDDPGSILKCTNKVYLAELFRRRKIPAPKTTLVHRANLKDVCKNIKTPVVLKRPDGCFSQGVIKVDSHQELKSSLKLMLEDSDLVVVQEFTPTDFDWRIGVLDGKPLYASKYYMAENHWQIYQKQADGEMQYGDAESLLIENVPEKLLNLAVQASAAIGNGLYGLDIKETQGKYLVIEINDNPNIDAGVEDEILQDSLYTKVMNYFLENLQKRTKGEMF